MKQTTFASLAFERKKKKTHRKRFLADMEAVVRWAALLAVIAPHCPTTGPRGRPPMPLSTMLRNYFLQQRYALSHPAIEDALYEVESMRGFAGLDLTDDEMPDETTTLKFRDLLAKHGLTLQMMNLVNDTLEQRGLLLEGDRAVLGHKGYMNNTIKRLVRRAGMFWEVSLNANKTRPLSGANKRFSFKMTSIRARVVHVLRVIKRQFGYTKVRYMELAKNVAQVFSLIGLTKLYLVRPALMH